jgi:UDP-N-acetylbacillosamine N-acetyltransferase
MRLEVTTKQLIVLGFGGHARSVADVALALGYKTLVFVDEQARDGELFLDFPVLKSFTPDDPKVWCGFPASGNGLVRQAQTELIQQQGWHLISLIAPSATLGVGCVVSQGVFIGQQAHIGPMSQVGRGSIINSGAVVEHECAVGEWAHVSVNATMAGRSFLGDYSMLGAGATVLDGVCIGTNILVGAASFVNKSIFDSGVYVGTPFRKLQNKCIHE